MGIFLSGYVPPRPLDLDPVLESSALKLISHISRNRSIFIPRSIKFEKKNAQNAHKYKLTMRNIGYNSLLTNALNRLFKSNLSLNTYKTLTFQEMSLE